MLLPLCSESALRACARKLEMASASFGFTRTLSRTTRGALGGGRSVAGTAAEVWRLGLRLLDEPLDQLLRLPVPGRDPVLGQRLLRLRRREASLERTQVPANLNADGRVLHARLEVRARMLVEFTERVPDGLRLLNDRAHRIRVVVGPGCSSSASTLWLSVVVCARAPSRVLAVDSSFRRPPCSTPRCTSREWSPCRTLRLPAHGL